MALSINNGTSSPLMFLDGTLAFIQVLAIATCHSSCRHVCPCTCMLLNLPGGHLLRRRRFGIRRHGLGWRLSFGKGRWSAVPVVRRLLLLRRDCGNQHQQEPTKYASHTDLLILGCQVIRCRRRTWGALVSNRN